ncbi:MAG: hypothetical protein J6386_08325 [Candidatus Synoicihabitans palmerolidicus]|nr:hypothetical protein [Candidatus Synoicihabitans palmerolidicus]
MPAPKLYTDLAPSAQSLVNLFQGEWSPPLSESSAGGTAGFCEDERIT